MYASFAIFLWKQPVSSRVYMEYYFKQTNNRGQERNHKKETTGCCFMPASQPSDYECVYLWFSNNVFGGSNIQHF